MLFVSFMQEIPTSEIKHTDGLHWRANIKNIIKNMHYFNVQVISVFIHLNIQKYIVIFLRKFLCILHLCKGGMADHDITFECNMRYSYLLL